MAASETDEVSQADFSVEKSMWEILLLLQALPINWANQIITALSGAAAGFYAFWLAPSDVLTTQSRSLASLGFVFATTLLGFLVAGFTIGTTVVKPDLFVFMTTFKESKSGISYLKYFMMIFMKAFFVFLALAGLCLFILVFGTENGLISTLLQSAPGYEEWMGNLMASGVYTILTIWITASLMALKSFIYSTYASVMLAIRWEIERTRSGHGH